MKMVWVQIVNAHCFCCFEVGSFISSAWPLSLHHDLKAISEFLSVGCLPSQAKFISL